MLPPLLSISDPSQSLFLKVWFDLERTNRIHCGSPDQYTGLQRPLKTYMYTIHVSGMGRISSTYLFLVNCCLTWRLIPAYTASERFCITKICCWLLTICLLTLFVRINLVTTLMELFRFQESYVLQVQD